MKDEAPPMCATPSRSACGIYATLPPVVHPAGRPRALQTPALLAAPRRIAISRPKRELPPLGSSARSLGGPPAGISAFGFEKRGGLVAAASRERRVTSLAYRSIRASERNETTALDEKRFSRTSADNEIESLDLSFARLIASLTRD